MRGDDNITIRSTQVTLGSEDIFLVYMIAIKVYTRRQINQDRMIFGDFSVNSEPMFLKGKNYI